MVGVRRDLGCFQFRQSVFVSYHKRHWWIVFLYQIVQIKRLAEDEQAAAEGVADFELGVFGFFHDESVVAEIAESAAAVGFPRHHHMVADR